MKPAIEIKTRLNIYCVFSPADGCWLWIGQKNRNGYGRLIIDGRRRMAHIVSYHVYVGPVPRKKVLDHKCRNRACINPEHLEPKTGKANTLLGVGPTAINAQKTHCVRGHELPTVRTNGRRLCKACRRLRSRRVEEQAVNE